MTPPTLYWIRRDLRLDDNPALTQALALGPVIPVFILDPETEALGAAPKWRLGLGLDVFAKAMTDLGGKIIFRRGPALDCLKTLAAETGAKKVMWNRLYEPVARARDTDVKEGLRAVGLHAESFAGHLLHEPWEVQTGQGNYYKVYTPFWKALKDRNLSDPLPSPARFHAPETWPQSESLEAWKMGAAMRRGAGIVQDHLCLGEQAAAHRADLFFDEKIETYAERRDMLAQDGTSRLSEPLTYGEISPRRLWHRGMSAWQQGAGGAEVFLKEIHWRDFAHHLAFHTPQITTENWRPEWNAFPWKEDNPEAEAWRRGRTGLQVVDAGLREMYVTGTMHNRARMLVASYLTKHLMTHWRVGLKWFEDCLVDWDPASNAMGWQWAAGSGPDAAPYFRVFNPETQAEKFDPRGSYRRKWIAEISNKPTPTALCYFDAIPKSWDMAPHSAYPAAPIVAAKEGRERALSAYSNRSWA